MALKRGNNNTVEALYISDFDYDLPEHLIARQPPAERDASRLLHVRDDGISDRVIRDLPELVQAGDVWVINDTKVIPARLLGRKQSGGKVELLLLEPADEDDGWLAWGKANKPLKPGNRVEIADGFFAEVLARRGRDVTVRLRADDVAAAIERYGHIPLPPYIDRPDTREDKARYQTIFATHPGAVAAPTAGLHLTSRLMRKMETAGAVFAHITLHVGPGTFQPIQVERIADHAMHEEAYVVPRETAVQVNRAKCEGHRIVAVGTTSLRALEAAGRTGALQAGNGRTDLFITPGYRLGMADALLTNFHLPRSTLLILVCALAGRKRILNAYADAKKCGYRFYSYGDAMFVDCLSK